MRMLVGTLALAVSLTTLGSLGRQAFNLGAYGPVVGWTCPHCGKGNAGVPAARLRAACRGCSNRFEWEAVAARTADGRPASAVQ